jgi:hypothetical protein
MKWRLSSPFNVPKANRRAYTFFSQPRVNTPDQISPESKYYSPGLSNRGHYFPEKSTIGLFEETSAELMGGVIECVIQEIN